MERILHLPIEIVEFQTQRCVVISLTIESIPKLTLECSLLDYGLIPGVILIAQNHSFKLRMRKDDTLARSEIGNISFSKTEASLALSENSLQYLLRFLLESYRDDGENQINHVDIDLPYPATNISKSVYVTFQTSKHKPLRMSTQELKRHLDEIDKAK